MGENIEWNMEPYSQPSSFCGTPPHRMLVCLHNHLCFHAYELLTQTEVYKVVADMGKKLKKNLQMPPLPKEMEQTITKIWNDDAKYVFY